MFSHDHLRLILADHQERKELWLGHYPKINNLAALEIKAVCASKIFARGIGLKEITGKTTKMENQDVTSFAQKFDQTIVSWKF